MAIPCEYSIRLPNGTVQCRLKESLTAASKRKLVCDDPNSNACAEAYVRKDEDVVNSHSGKTFRRAKQ